MLKIMWLNEHFCVERALLVVSLYLSIYFIFDPVSERFA
jgi:hypothetical protein